MACGASHTLSVSSTPPIHVEARIPIARSMIHETPGARANMLFPPTFLLGAADVDLSSFFDTPIPPSVDRATEDKAKARRAAIEEEEAIKQARAATAIARMEAENARKEAFADKLAASGVPPCKLPCRPKSVVSARRGASCARVCVCVDPAAPQATPNRNICSHILPPSCVVSLSLHAHTGEEVALAGGDMVLPKGQTGLLSAKVCARDRDGLIEQGKRTGAFLIF